MLVSIRNVAQKIHISNIQTPSFYCRIIYTLKNDRNKYELN